MSDKKNKIRWTKAKQRGIKKNFTKHNYKIKKELYPIIHGGSNYSNNTVSYDGIKGEKKITLINYDNEKENMEITIKDKEFNLKNIIALAKGKIREIKKEVSDDNLITLGISGRESGISGFYMLEGITTSSDRSNVYKVLKDNPIRYIIPPPKTGKEVEVVDGNITLSCKIILMGDIINININSNEPISALKNKILEDSAITKKGIKKINLMYDGITIQDDTVVIKNIIKTITEILIIPIIDHLDEIPDPPPAPFSQPPETSRVGTRKGPEAGEGASKLSSKVRVTDFPLPNQPPSKFCITETDLPMLIKHFEDASTSLKNISSFYSKLNKP